MENDLRDTIARRVRALLAKTVENGATEAEAIAAAQKARELLDAHRLSQADCEIEAEPIDDVLIERPNQLKMAAVDYCLFGIDAYCGVETWFNKRNNVRKVRCIGLHDDVEMAIYLYKMIAGAIAAESKRYTALNPGRGIKASFEVGMARRINDRLKEMAAVLAPVAKTATGSALVLVKDKVVKDYVSSLHLRLASGQMSGMRAGNGTAFAAGSIAGDRVNLSRPVNSNVAGRLR